jgi:hypothetical protein
MVGNTSFTEINTKNLKKVKREKMKVGYLYYVTDDGSTEVQHSFITKVYDKVYDGEGNYITTYCQDVHNFLYDYLLEWYSTGVDYVFYELPPENYPEWYV